MSQCIEMTKKTRKGRTTVGCFVLFLGFILVLGITMDCLGMGLLMFQTEGHLRKSERTLKRKVAANARPSLQREGLRINNELRLCKEQFEQTLQSNIDVIRNYPRGTADEFILKIRGNFTEPLQILKLPVLVIAIDDANYHEAKGLLMSVHQKIMKISRYRKIKLIVYDIGMKGEQLKTVMEHCKCEVRSWYPGTFPAHVNHLENRAFKPIIIQKLLVQYGFVWWLDTSIRFLDGDIGLAINYATNNSLLFYTSTENRKHDSITKHTHQQTFKFLHEDECKFQPFSMTLTSSLLFHHDHVTQVLVDAWVVCALNADCIAPNITMETSERGASDHVTDYCHQFDQSVFSILTRRIFHEHNFYPVNSKLHKLFVVKVGQIKPYF